MGDKLVRPYGRELWIIDEDTLEWFIQIECNGIAWYNQKKFYDLLRIFSFEENENKFFIKIWIEENFGVRISSLSRKNTNYQYIIEGILRSHAKDWSLSQRYGFSYQVVKRYTWLKEHNSSKVQVKDFY